MFFMNKQNNIVLVTGATGSQGSAVAHQLLSNGYKIKALVRKPNSEKAQRLAQLGAELVRGDFDDSDSLKNAMSGVWGVFAVQNSHEAGVEKEETQGKTIAQLAREEGVSHFVYNSVAGTNGKTGLAHFDNKWRIEQTVRSVGFPSYTILKPVTFMDNLISEQFIKMQFPKLPQGRLETSMTPETKLQLIAAEDIGKFGFLAFERYEQMNGKTIDIAGDERTMPEMARILSHFTDMKIDYVQVSKQYIAEVASEVWAEFEDWNNRVGYPADINALKKDYNIELTTLPEWLEQHEMPWQKKISVM
jgi:uncharacterized protein YbjT (DUF2867 family)